MSFAWMFAIAVGAIIIFLAIYLAVKIVGTKDVESATVVAHEFGNILDPLDVGSASAKSAKILLNEDIRIYNRCYENEPFGRQDFSVSEYRRNEWREEGIPVRVQNKYVFSKAVPESDEFYFFSKSFEFPFKVSDVIFMTTGKYCFVSPPSEIAAEIVGLKFENIKTIEDRDDCLPDATTVCFDSSGCDISVVPMCSGYGCDSRFDYGMVQRGSETMYYVQRSLMYGAIFSDQDIYECNVKRLMMRVKQIAFLYSDEANYLIKEGCGNVMSTNLLSFATNANIQSSAGVVGLRAQALQLDEQNKASKTQCYIWGNL